MRHEAVLNNRILLHVAQSAALGQKMHNFMAKDVQLQAKWSGQIIKLLKCYKNHELHALGSKRRLTLQELHE